MTALEALRGYSGSESVDTDSRHAPGWVGTRAMGVAALAAVALVAAAVRLIPAASPLWHDEIYTVVHYVSGGPESIFGAGYIANNHILFSLFAWGTTTVLPTSEVTLRIGGFAPAIAATLLAMVWMWRRVGPASGLAFGLALSTAPVIALATFQARGYGIALLGALLMLIAIVRLEDVVEGRSGLDVATFALGAFLATSAFPMAAFVAATHFTVALFRIRRRLLLAAGTAIAAVLTLLLYLPVLDEFFSEASFLLDLPGAERSYSPRTLLERIGYAGFTAARLVPRLDFGLEEVGFVAASGAALSLGITAWLVLRAVRCRGFADPLTAHGLAMLAMIGALLVFTTPTSRFLLPLSVAPLALASSGLQRKRVSPTLFVGAALLVSVVASASALGDAVRLAVKPMEDYERVASLAEAHGARAVYTDTTDRRLGLEYYLDIPVRSLGDPADACAMAGPAMLSIWNDDYRSRLDGCLSDLNVTAIEIGQQYGRQTVYLVGYGG